ncbi:MAG: TonB-dependent receptor, partial [Methylobacter sp.]
PDMLSTVPRHLYQLNFMTPLFSPKWRGGFDMQVLASRTSLQSKTPGYTRVGLNLLYQPITYLDLSASVYDLLGDNRLEPGGIFGIPQEGRTFRLKFECRF